MLPTFLRLFDFLKECSQNLFDQSLMSWLCHQQDTVKSLIETAVCIDFFGIQNVKHAYIQGRLQLQLLKPTKIP